MRRGRRRPLLRWAAVAAFVGSVVAFPATAIGAAGQHGADLVVRIKIQGLGTPPHILVGASGLAPRFAVVVTTENQGDRGAGPSRTAMTIDAGGLPRPYSWKVRALGAHDSAPHTVIVEGLKPDLGFTEVKARADFKGVVAETHNGNNESKKKIAVEPREWDVSLWKTEDVALGIDNVTQADTGFFLRFQKYDDGFTYQAYGPIKDTPKTYPGCAPVSGSKTITQSPWPMSIMKINPDLRSYDAFVPTSTNSFMASCNVSNQSFPIQVSFVDLTTGIGVPKKDPEDKVLEGVDSGPAPGGGRTGWAWTFTAHLPKR